MVIFVHFTPFILLSFRMKKKYYSWDECLNLREVKVTKSFKLKYELIL